MPRRLIDRAHRGVLWVSLLLLASPEAAWACEHCFGAGNLDTPVTQGIGLAMLSLLGMTGLVMGGIVVFFVNLNKRTRRLAPSASVVTEDGEILDEEVLDAVRRPSDEPG